MYRSTLGGSELFEITEIIENGVSLLTRPNGTFVR